MDKTDGNSSRVSVHRVVVLRMQTSAFFYRLKYTDSGLMHYLTVFFFNLMNEDQAGQAHLQILRCYFISQPRGPLRSAGRVA